MSRDPSSGFDPKTLTSESDEILSSYGGRQFIQLQYTKAFSDSERFIGMKSADRLFRLAKAVWSVYERLLIADLESEAVRWLDFYLYLGLMLEPKILVSPPDYMRTYRESVDPWIRLNPPSKSHR